MYHFHAHYLISPDEVKGSVTHAPYRAMLLDAIGWFCVNAANHVVLDRTPLYRLGSYLINKASDLEEPVISDITLTPEQTKVFMDALESYGDDENA